jgi:two-component system, sensor histidine kinase and response regulator
VTLRLPRDRLPHYTNSATSSAATTPGRAGEKVPRDMSQIYDYTGSLHRMGDDQALFHEMVTLLRCDVPKWLNVVLAAEREGDASRVQRAAHTLKGLAANFGAGRAVAAAAEVEQLAKSQTTVGLRAAVVELETSLDELLIALSAPLATSATL